MDQTDATMNRIAAAVEHGRAGHLEQARTALTALWDEIGPDGDALHRCTLAHYLADLQDTTEAELHWDQQALAAASTLTDKRAQDHHTSLTIRGFLPSLHLNLADDHRRLGHTEAANEHLTAAQDLLHHLPDDEYGRHLRHAVNHVTQALATGTTAHLPTSPSTR